MRSPAIVLPECPVEFELPLGERVEGLAGSDHGDWLLSAGAMVRNSVMDVRLRVDFYCGDVRFSLLREEEKRIVSYTERLIP